MGECRSVGRRVNIKLTEQIHNANFNPCNACPSNARFVIFFTFTVYFTPCCVRPSNARFVIFFTFTVADAAGAELVGSEQLAEEPYYFPEELRKLV